MTYNRGVYVNTVSVWNSSTNTYIPLDVEGLEAAGIRDIYLLCRITTSPNYDTILPHILDDIEGSSLRVWAWFIPSTGYVPTNTTYNAAIYNAIDDILSTYQNVYGVVLDEFRWAGGSSSKSAEQTPNGNIAVTNFHKTAYNHVKSHGSYKKVMICCSGEISSYGGTYVADYYYGYDYEDLTPYADYFQPMLYAGDFGWTNSMITSIVTSFGTKTNKPIVPAYETYNSDLDPTKKSVAMMTAEAQAGIDGGAEGYAFFRLGLMLGYPYIADPGSTPDSTTTEWMPAGAAENVACSGCIGTWVHTSYATGTCSGSCTLENSAYIDAGIPKNGGVGKFLKLTGFGFSIPSDAVITGVEVQICKKQNSSAHVIKDNTVQLMYSGSLIGDNKAKTNEWWLWTYMQSEYGDDTDNWNAGLTPAIVNSSSFGVGISLKNYSSYYQTVTQIDCVQIRVSYTTEQEYTAEGNANIEVVCTATGDYTPGNSARVIVQNPALFHLQGISSGAMDNNRISVKNVRDGTDTLGDTTGFVKLQNAEIESTTEEHFEGVRSLKCHALGGSLGGVQATGLITYKSEAIAFTCRVLVPTGGHIRVWAINKAYTKIGNIVNVYGNDNWQYITVPFTNPSNDNAVRINFACDSAFDEVTFYIDKCRCYPGTALSSDFNYPLVNTGSYLEVTTPAIFSLKALAPDEVNAYPGYIGPVKLSHKHEVSNLKGSIKDNLLSEGYLGRSVMGKKGEPTTSNSFKAVMKNEDSFNLKGMVNMDEIVPIDMDISMPNNNPLLPRGYALVSSIDPDFLNLSENTLSLEIALLTNNINPVLNYDYTTGVNDRTELDTEFEAANLNYSIQEDDWATFVNDFNDAMVVGLQDDVDAASFVVEDEQLHVQAAVETAGNGGYISATKNETYDTPLFVEADMFRDASLPADTTWSGTAIFIGNQDLASNDVSNMNQIRCRIKHSSTGSTIIIESYSAGVYTTLASVELGTEVTECKLIANVNTEMRLSVWYNIGTDADVQILKEVPIELGSSKDLYVAIYGYTTSDEVYDMGFNDLIIWNVSYETQVTSTETSVGEADSEGPNSPGTAARVAAEAGNNQWGGGNQTEIDKIKTQNDHGCYCQMYHTNTDKYSDYLRATNYGFSIPSDAVIKGVEVTIRREQSGETNTHDQTVQLVNNGVAIGINKAKHTRYPPSGAYGYTNSVYGGSDDLWEITNLTPAIINSSTFGVQLRVYNESSYDPTVYVDYISIKVYYQTSGVVTSTSIYVPATIHNVVKAPICDQIAPLPDFWRKSSHGDIPCFVNPSENILFKVAPERFYDGAVKIRDKNRVQVLNTEHVFDDELYLENGVIRIKVDIDSNLIYLYGFYGGYNLLQKLSIGEIYDVHAYVIGSEKTTLKINDTYWRLTRGAPYITVEHPMTSISYEPKTTYYHDDAYGTASEEDIIGINKAVDMQNIFYCNVYDSIDLIRFQILKTKKQNILNNIIPADEVTGLGWYYKNATEYEHYSYRAREWLIQQRNTIKP